jgi:hypothetical protein
VRGPAITVVALALALPACSATSPVAAPASPSAPEPAARPPTPKSITRENPGGDSDDPERAALERLLAEPWGYRPDSWSTLRVPVPDQKTWSNVTIWGHPTRLSLEYGDDRYAVSSLWYTPTDGPNDAESCLDRFLVHAADVAKRSAVKVGPHERVRVPRTVRGEDQTLVVELVEGTGETLILHDEYVAAVTSYPSWPGTCLVHGFAVVSTRHRALAEKIRDRWVHEGATRLDWRPQIKTAPALNAR